MAMESQAVSLQARQAVAPVRMARRIGAFGWFLSHCIAVATLTALGAVVVLAAVTLFCLTAPIAGVGLYAVMRRHDLRLRVAAPV